ncbi:MAG: hypothetical protein D3M94_14000 [Rhodocyclales bacterium GT-UBC]|nr:MAG: hypothetical protein D3M94_14000 [Rhodocyclales bacterium GT-UBC]
MQATPHQTMEEVPPQTIQALHTALRSAAAERAAGTQKPPVPPLPAAPDFAAGCTLALILEGRQTAFSTDMFEELIRRNRAIVDAPRSEVLDTLARQISLLEATALRLFEKAALEPHPSAAAEYTRLALATNRVLIQALGAVHQMNQDRVPALPEADQ